MAENGSYPRRSAPLAGEPGGESGPDLDSPSHPEGERYVLAFIFANLNLVDKGAALRVVADDFAGEEHRIIFGEIMAQRARGDGISPVSVGASLLRQGHYRNARLKVELRLAEVAAYKFDPEEIEARIAFLKRLKYHRLIAGIFLDSYERIMAPEVTPAERIDGLTKQLMDLRIRYAIEVGQ